MTEAAGWCLYSRSGQVIAVRLTGDIEWTTENNDHLHGRAGDWKLHQPADPAGVWTVANGEFRVTYRHVAGDIYERVGTVEARPARAGEVIKSAEGDVRAHEGDWLVRRESGYCWVVPREKFRATYERL